ncbi:hypothetical protein LOAG_03031 [Loa loa]|uniref:Zinc finger protein n=1 Tax=Loa loa TaxID=7209 RepID=A0A1I7VLW6_LOALO|nr:hypothetical protein LOAG_03031 [Loa loa]EFO25448.1 hypothetical protein LOAG_03031 [Loa loa]
MSCETKRRKATAKRIEKRHACPICDARFPFPNKLRLHIHSNHSLANVCELCPERFNRFNELRTHMRRAHQIVHQCHLCAYSSSVKTELRKHVVKCHENGVRCTVDGCAATVAYNRLRRHITEAHCNSLQSSQIVNDQMLGESPKSENNVSEDLPVEVKFSSAVEGSVVTNAFSGIEFVNIHDNLPPMDKMQKPTSNHVSPKTPSQNLEASIRLSSTVQHDGAITENDCSDRCGRTKSVKAFKLKRDNAGNVYREKSLEIPTQPDALEMKDQVTSRKVSLACSERGGYECQKCGKIFYDVYNSRRHWNRVHLKRHKERVRLKKYACKISTCMQRFPCPSKLRDHIFVAHSEDAPFDCETCNRKFSSRASFAIHLRRYHLVSIRDVPYGFTDGNGASTIDISGEVTAQDTVNETEVVADNIFTKE